MADMYIDLTNEDKQMYCQIDAAIKETIMPNTHHRLCCWYKVNRGYITKVKKIKIHYIDVVFVEACQNCFYSFKTDINSERKEAAHIKFFEMWLNQKKKLFPKDYSLHFYLLAPQLQMQSLSFTPLSL